MTVSKQLQITNVLNHLFSDAKFDMLKMMKGASKSLFRPLQPSDFKDVYLSISKTEGKELTQLVIDNNIKNIVEFGTSFGISTLCLAKGAVETGGKIITTELIDSKAQIAKENFEKAGVSDLIEVRVGDAMETLKNHDQAIDLLFLDGWKDLYLPLFQMLESHFHSQTLIYVDNANFPETKRFLRVIAQNEKFEIEHKFGGKIAIISLVK